MVLVLRSDEKMEKKIDINSRFGKAIMYVTTKAIVMEHQQKGIFFERLHTQIASMEAVSHNKIKVKWPEERQLFDFEFKTSDAGMIVKEIVERHNYDENFPDLMGG